MGYTLLNGLIMETVLSALTYVILGAGFLTILYFQRRYWRQAKEAGRSLESEGFEEGEIARVLDSVRTLARNRQPFDWAATFDRFDRITEHPLDEIRRSANAALVTGVGGTMGLFIIDLFFHFVFFPSGEKLLVDDELRPSVLIGALLALLSSLIGVLFHLNIVLRWLSRAQTSAANKVKELIARAHQLILTTAEELAAEEEQPPIDLDGTFAESIARYPELLQRADASIQSLRKEVARQVDLLGAASGVVAQELKGIAGVTKELAAQKASLQKALETQQEQQEALGTRYDSLIDLVSSALITHQQTATAAQEVVNVVAVLKALPERLADTINAATTAWEDQQKRGHDVFANAVGGYLDDHRAILAGIKAQFEEEQERGERVQQAQAKVQQEIVDKYERLTVLVESFPKALRVSLEQMSDIFGQEARNHVKDLERALNDGLGNLDESFKANLQRLSQDIGAGAASIIEQTLGKLSQEIQQGVLTPLEKTGRHLDDLVASALSTYQQTVDSAQNVANATAVLQTLPERLTDTINVATTTWENQQKRGHDVFANAVGGYLDEHRTILEGIKAQVEKELERGATAQQSQANVQQEIMDKYERLTLLVESLPKTLRESLDQMSHIFGREGRNYVAKLEQALNDGLSNLDDTFSTNLRTLSLNIGEEAVRVIEQTLGKLTEEMKQGVLIPLEEMGRHLDAATEAMPAGAERFGQAMLASVTVLEELPKALADASKRVNSVAKDVTGIAEDLNVSIEGAIKDAWEPVTGKMLEFAEQAKDTHKELEELIDGLVKFIQELVDRIGSHVK